MILGQLYTGYRYRLKPHIKHLRGADFLGRKLAQMADRALPATQGTPTPITELEWDNLIILDACRLDTFQEVVGDCGTRTTVGSHSREYVKKTFSTGELQDTVYVTPNPPPHRRHLRGDDRPGPGGCVPRRRHTHG